MAAMPLRLLFIIVIAFAGGSLAALLLRPGGPTAMQSARALIGGPFSLTDQDGKRVTEQDYRGKYMLVVFGYTTCPDVCPAELQTMANAIDVLGDKAERVNPVFITVDPERDTVERVADYVKNFHTRFIGLTGSAEEIRKAARAYRVYYAKGEEKGSAAGYLMDHSAFIYLMNPQGEYVTHFAYGIAPEKIAASIEKAMSGAGSS
jgi:cytochrome oxidase Cu insertion factor (SCO1/SenC/PrrC family)